MKNKTVGKRNLELIEAELYFYRDTKNELLEMEDDIAGLSSTPDGTGGKGGISKPTERKATNLLTSKELLEVKRRIDAIEYMIRILKNCDESKKLKLIELKYFERKYEKDIYIWEELFISKKTFYRWKLEALSLVASKLGYRI